MITDFVREMHRFITQHKMIMNGETVLVAVSGGADSLALLYGLHALRQRLKCHLHVVHLNHRLRPEADTDADFVRQHAEHLNLPCTIQQVDVFRLAKQSKLSLETAGRRARYQFYDSVCAETGATKVALGHQKDDTAETVLMNLIRGSGTDGLKGISPIRDRKFIRPLIEFTRQQIEAFLTSIDVVPRQDATNTDTYYLRNRIRHELIPRLVNNYNPNIKTALSRTANVLGTEAEYFDTIARTAFEACQIQTQQETIILDREKFRQYHLALQRRILRQSVAQMLGAMSDLYFPHCNAMLSLIEGDTPNAVLPLPNGLQFRRAYQRIIFEQKTTEIGNFSYPITTVGETYIAALNAKITVEFGHVAPNRKRTFPDGKFEAIFDYEMLRILAEPFEEALPLTLRNRREGDRFRPYGMQGTKKIKDFFIDVKVPRHERDNIPLLVSGDSILWVIGYTTNDFFKIQPSTRHYLYVTYASIDETAP